ncbi:MAG: lysophospholipid acyltransferase family protein [Pseudomonadota bacterium]|nr:lysophospholipid acyltransferase family protein [Pseudomonadota bacterium]
MRRLRGIVRLLRCGLHILRGAFICALIFPFIPAPKRMVHVGRWSVRMLAVLGIELRASGTPEHGAALFVANHVSWIDILAINAVRPVRFVSKSDVRAWPLIGWLVACGGTLFIERARPRDALRVVHLVAEALKAGEQIAVFPEGTTSDGRSVLAFHANLLQAAISTEVPVQAVALRFSDVSAPISDAAAYVGDTTLVQSLWAVASACGLTAHVSFLPPRSSRHEDRRALAARLRDDIAAQVSRVRS